LGYANDGGAQIGGGDIAFAESLIRRLDLMLRTPDALNIAIAIRVGATLATFDVRMAEAARKLGAAVADV
jgi:predicted nucleic acid-binding protein